MDVKIGKLSFSNLGVLLFLLAMYSIGTISAIAVSWTVTLALLVLSTGLILLNFIIHKGRYFSNLVVVWIVLTLLCLIGIVRGNSTIVLLFYILCLFVLLMSEKISVKSLYHNLKLFKISGLFFAFGCYWQYLFPDRYYNLILPLFGAEYQHSIRRQFTFHKMCTGFTFQTAVTAQFIVLGIMAVLYLYSTQKTNNGKIISIIEIVLMTGGLLLTGKRSPILNFGAAFIVVDLLTVKRSKKGNRIVAFSLGLIIALTALYFLAPLFAGSRNTLVRFLEFTTIEDLEEASNGRFGLFSHAISEFIRHPILGIGWGRYSRIYHMTGVHNIYLQLLCECGIFGFLIAMLGMIFTLTKTIKMLKDSTLNVNSPSGIILKCSVFIQIYILVYGLFGNPIYDQNYLLMYCIGIMFSAVAAFNRKNDYNNVIMKQV